MSKAQKFSVLLGLLFLCGVMVLAPVLNNYYHEKTHQDIARSHGCMDGSIEMSLLKSSFTCYEYSNVSTVWRLQEANLHNLNEISSYNAKMWENTLLGITSMIIIFLILLMLYKQNKQREEC